MMEKTPFDTLISRSGTYSAKYHHSSDNTIALSVADMDFPTAPCIKQALAAANDTAIYGYTLLSDDWQSVAAGWFSRRYQWTVSPEHIVFCPRVVQAVSLWIQNFTRPGEAIATLSPGYHPISHAVEVNQRRLLESPLRYSHGRYAIDFADLEQKFRRAACFIFISPHNPTGTVWDEKTLLKIAALAEKHHVFIISDDVHADFIFNNRRHRIISTLSEYVQQNSMICTSPAKTFNIAGLEVANVVIASAQHRQKFSAALTAAGIHNPGYFTVPAFLAAYREGENWLSGLLDYLAENRRWVSDFCQRSFPDWRITDGDGTYMLWIDYRAMNTGEAQLRQLFSDVAHVEMNWGSDFGEAGAGFFRVNLALPRARLEEAFTRIAQALQRCTGDTTHG
ncbi:MalY/PatB family protein [Pluralibacter gergoviae]|uniref:MalY/PatB family protein n=1 Tax=Pluralibacter gergoviae TaxID=61647 RepID=UPI001F25821A|nr:MalY/PatB family protein [Pluralibacter gergoviae]